MNTSHPHTHTHTHRQSTILHVYQYTTDTAGWLTRSSKHLKLDMNVDWPQLTPVSMQPTLLRRCCRFNAPCGETYSNDRLRSRTEALLCRWNRRLFTTGDGDEPSSLLGIGFTAGEFEMTYCALAMPPTSISLSWVGPLCYLRQLNLKVLIPSTLFCTSCQASSTTIHLHKLRCWTTETQGLRWMTRHKLSTTQRRIQTLIKTKKHQTTRTTWQHSDCWLRNNFGSL